MKLTKKRLQRLIKEQVKSDRLAQAIGVLEDVMLELENQGAQRDSSKSRDPYRHKKTGIYGGSEAVRRAEEAETAAQYAYDDLKPLMNILLSMQGSD